MKRNVHRAGGDRCETLTARLIDRTIRDNPGSRILVTFGGGHKYWILEQLSERSEPGSRRAARTRTTVATVRECGVPTARRRCRSR